MRELIAISGKQFVGKDLLADMLAKALPEYRKSPIAWWIKLEYASLYNMTPQDIEAQKAVYRPGLITIGQRRRAQDPNYWLKQVTASPGPKIVSDIRLKSEYDYFKSHGAFMIRLEADRDVRAKRGSLVMEDDPTECELDTVTGWDALLVNNGTPDDLRKQVQLVLEQL